MISVPKTVSLEKQKVLVLQLQSQIPSEQKLRYHQQTENGLFHHTLGWVTVMKIGETKTLGFSSALWENDELLNENSNVEAAGDAKYQSWTKSFSSIRMCVGSPNTNCVERKFEKTYKSAKELFASGDETISQDGILKSFGPAKGSYQDCGMQRPGFNIQCKDGNSARWGYCNNCASQACQLSNSNDADGAIGIGLSGQSRWPNPLQ